MRSILSSIEFEEEEVSSYRHINEDEAQVEKGGPRKR
jgi:hypothetical protein